MTSDLTHHSLRPDTACDALLADLKNRFMTQRDLVTAATASLCLLERLAQPEGFVSQAELADVSSALRAALHFAGAL